MQRLDDEIDDYGGVIRRYIMNHMIESIKERRSVRTYDGRILDKQTKDELIFFMENIKNPFNIPVVFKFLNAKEQGLVCPVVNGTDMYVGGKIKNVPNANAAFGFSFETFILYAQSLGLGTVWLGGTMNRPAYEAAMEMNEDEMMPCASPVGYPSKKMSMRENMMRKAVKANVRLDFEEIFFDGAFDRALSKEKAGDLKTPFEMVRLAPSAVNKQPWRVVLEGNSVHFYLKRSKGFGHDGKLDMQMVDMGIALCHFDLAAKDCGLTVEFEQNDPGIASGDMIYIASYKIL